MHVLALHRDRQDKPDEHERNCDETQRTDRQRQTGRQHEKQDSSSGIPVQRGGGQLVLHIDYTLQPDVRDLTLVAGVFRPPQRLLAWVSTNPIDLAPWPGRDR